MTDSRESALALLERTRKDYLAKARSVAAQIAYTTQQPVCVDDVRALCPPPESIDPRVMGAIFNHWSRRMGSSSCVCVCVCVYEYHKNARGEVP